MKPLSTGSKELDLLAEELKELQSEKSKLEQEATQQEAIMKLKQSEIKNLQNEAETLQQMIKQLETQKIEARKRLDEMSIQHNHLENTFCDLKQSVEEQTQQVENLRKQVEEQNEKIEFQEKELNEKQKELNELRSEENQLQTQFENCKKEVSLMSANLANSQLQISQYKTKLMHFEEYEKQLNDGINELDIALNNNDVQKISNILITSITPPLSDLINDSNNGFTSDSFKDKDAAFPSLSHEFTADPFAGEDPFDGEDLFPPPEPAANDLFSNDPFGSSAFPPSDADDKSRSFDPFNAAFSKKQEIVGGDPFGDDPFASVKGESPTPELPPKKSKAPPPRPVPPKHGNKPPPRPAPPQTADISADPFKKTDPWTSSSSVASNDPFAPTNNSSTQGSFDPFGSNFADFSNFDKLNLTPVDPYSSLPSRAKLRASSNKSDSKSVWSLNEDWFSTTNQNDLHFGDAFTKK